MSVATVYANWEGYGRQQYATTNYSTQYHSHAQDDAGAGADNFGMINFDLTGEIPTGSTITNVVYNATWIWGATHSAGTQAYLRLCDRVPTKTGFTYNTYNGSSSWGTVGAKNTSDHSGSTNDPTVSTCTYKAYYNHNGT